MQRTDSHDRNEIPVLEDTAVPLDFNLLTNFVTTLLYCNPKECPVLPTFRLQELMNLCLRNKSSKANKSNRSTPNNSSNIHSTENVSKGNSGSETLMNEFRMSNAVLAYFTLCYYLALSTCYPADLIIEIVLFLESMAIESLMQEHNASASYHYEMKALIPSFTKQEDIDIDFKYEIFADGLEAAKGILRDSLTTARIFQRMKDITKAEERKAAIPNKVDCYAGYCLYFMSIFTLSHIGINIHAAKNLELLPGFLETIILAILTEPASYVRQEEKERKEAKALQEEKNREKEKQNQINVFGGLDSTKIKNKGKKGEDGLPDKDKEKEVNNNTMNWPFITAVDYTQKLATFVAHVTFTEALLDEVCSSRSHNLYIK
jgi:hypothetical protein